MRVYISICSRVCVGECMGAYVCVHLFMNMCICVYKCIYIQVCVCMCGRVHIYICVYKCVCVCVCLYNYSSVCARVYLYMCTYACVCMREYTCEYLYKDRSESFLRLTQKEVPEHFYCGNTLPLLIKLEKLSQILVLISELVRLRQR